MNAIHATALAIGINPERLPLNPVIGKFYRLQAINKPSSDKSCYIKFMAQGVAVLGNWSTGDKVTHFDDKPTDKAELDRWQKEAKAAQLQAHNELLKQYDNAAIRARSIWDSATKDDLMHPYLIKKQLKPNGIKQCRDALIIPVYSFEHNAIQSLQFIELNGFKHFMKDGNAKGFFAARRYKTGEQIVIAEGWATSQSLAQQWLIEGWHVCAFNAGNLMTVAKAIRQRHPFAKIVIAADNDLSGTGQVMAAQAAKAIGASVSMPTFTEDERARYGKVSDWQDRWHIDNVNAEGGK